MPQTHAAFITSHSRLHIKRHAVKTALQIYHFFILITGTIWNRTPGPRARSPPESICFNPNRTLFHLFESYYCLMKIIKVHLYIQLYHYMVKYPLDSNTFCRHSLEFVLKLEADVWVDVSPTQTHSIQTKFKSRKCSHPNILWLLWRHFVAQSCIVLLQRSAEGLSSNGTAAVVQAAPDLHLWSRPISNRPVQLHIAA